MMTRPVMPLVRIAWIGHRDHGRVALAQTLARFLSDRGPDSWVDASQIDPPSGERRCFTDGPPFAECQTSAGRYALIDVPGPAQYVRAGMRPFDGAVLVAGQPLALARGPVALAGLIGAERIVVAQNAATGDWLAAERQVRELLAAYGVAGGEVPVVRVASGPSAVGDARAAGAGELLDAIEAHVPAPGPASGRPFMMQVEHVVGDTVAGTVLQGEIGVGEMVEVVGEGESFVTACTALRVPGGRHAQRIAAGDSAGLALGDAGPTRLRAGQVAAAPGTLTVRDRFRAWVHLLDDGPASPQATLRRGTEVRLCVRSAEMPGVVAAVYGLPPLAGTVTRDGGGGAGVARAGDTALMAIALARPAAISRGAGFAIRVAGHTVGVGTIIAAGLADP